MAPYKDTRFNRGRSVNNIHDHAAFGPAGIYSSLPPLNQTISNNTNGILVGEKSDYWEKAIKLLITDLEKPRKIAESGDVLARLLSNPEIIRKFWLDQLFGEVVEFH